MVLTSDNPVVIFLHGDDAFGMAQAVSAQIMEMGDPQTAEMNTVRLEGSQASPGEIKNAAATAPFLAPRRLVILNNPLARIPHNDRDAQKRFTDMLDSLPSSARVVLVIEDNIENKKVDGSWEKDWKVLSRKSWLRAWAEKTTQPVLDQAMPSPAENMPGWISNEAKRQGGHFSTEGAKSLADQVDNDTRFAAQEITKLLTYVNGQRPVGKGDVELLTSGKARVSIFEMTDSLASRNTRRAFALLHQLLDQEESRYIFSMVIRQFRLLIQARGIMDSGGSTREILSAGLSSGSPGVAKNLYTQAAGFPMERLKDLYRRLLALDIQIKTSNMTPELALEMIILEAAGESPLPEEPWYTYNES